MNKFFYSKLALVNIKNNSKTYFPYIISCICTVMMFYIMFFISTNDGLKDVADYRSLSTIMFMGTAVVGIFSTIFLFYTNSFLIKNRKKELGLYNVLGMEKKHIARVLFIETIFTAFITIILGLALGILMSKLMLLLLIKLLRFAVPFGFQISWIGILATVSLFFFVFVLILIKNLFQIHFTKPVEMLKGGQTGEKEPKAKLLITVLGAISLGAAYYIALTTESPISALSLFFVAVILVIIGTYCLFASGSIAMLKALRKNKSYYYKTKHFTSVSGMIYRMKQNSVGLASICILSTAVLVMFSTTVSLYIGIEDVLRVRYPRNIVVSGQSVSDEQMLDINNIIEQTIEHHNVATENTIKYRSKTLPLRQAGSGFFHDENIDYYTSKACIVTLLSVSEYNNMFSTTKTLEKDEVLLFCAKGEIEGERIEFGEYGFAIKERLENFDIDGEMTAMLVDNFYVVVPDTETIERIFSSVGFNEEMGELEYTYGFDLSSESQEQIEMAKTIRKEIKEDGIKSVRVEGAQESKASFYSLYGGLFFLGIFLGALFLLATVLIIYYKQISEGYDDRERFRIMQNVGMSRFEVRNSIRSQVLTVFFLPLIASVIHIAFAFKVITRLLLIFNLVNTPLFALCTIGTILLFAVFYAIVYSLTARTYYKIVQQ